MGHFKILLVFLLSFCVTMAVAQQYTPMTAAGYAMKRVKVDSTLHLPSFCGVPTLRNSTAINGALAMDTCNNKLYKWTNQSGWSVVGQLVDTSLYVKYTDTATMLSKYLRKSDTASLSNRINLKVNIADTASMLTPYLRKVDTASLSNRINLKVNISDTASMLTPYLRIIDTTNKWVSSVTKLNDSTIQVIKDGTTTNITLSPSTTVTNATRLVTQVYNNSGSTITKGSVIYINGRHSSNLPTIALAQANTEQNSYSTFALVLDDIVTSNSGTVVQAGSITNLNLPTSTYSDGQLVYLSPTVAGGITTTKPLAPNHIVKIGTITRAHPTFGTIELKIENGWQLDEMSDVQIPAVPNDSTLLQFSRVDSLWHSVSPTNAIGNRYIKPSDTTAMLSPYQRSNDAVTLSTTQTITGRKTFNPSVTAASAIARGTYFTPTLTAAANNDTLVGLDIKPSFTNGAFTGIQNIGLRLNSNTSATDESILLYNNNNTGGSGSSIRFRNGYTGAGQGMIWNAIDMNFAVGGGGNILLKTSNGLGADATTKMTIGTTSITSNVAHSFSSGITGQLDIFRGATTDPATGINKNLVANISTGGGTAGTSIAVGNTGSYSANISAYGVYINNTATVSGTGQKFNIFSIGSSLNHLNGNTLIGTTTDAGYKLDVNGTARVNGSTTFGTIGTGTGLFWDNTNNRLGIGTSSPNYAFEILKTTNGAERINVRNNSNGTTAQALYNAQNDAGNSFQMGITSSGWTTASGQAAQDVYLQANTTGTLLIRTVQNTAVKFNVNTTNEIMRLSPTNSNLLIGTTTDVASAKVVVESTTQGFLPPRMTTTQRDAIASPAAGLIIYNTTTNKHQGYNGTTWNDFY